MKTPEQKTQEALSFLKENYTGVISTIAADGRPQAAMVFYTADDDFGIVFATLSGTHKHSNVQEDARVAFTVAATEVPQTLQIEGTAEMLSNAADLAGAMMGLLSVHTKNKTFYPPLAKLKDGGFDLVKITPTSVRWYDYAFADDGAEHVIV